MNSSDFARPTDAFEFAIGGVGTVTQALFIALSGGLLYLSLCKRKQFESDIDAIVKEEKPEEDLSRPTLQPLTTSTYSTTSPPNLRPYHSTAVHASSANDLVVIDNTYCKRLAYRRYLLSTQPAETYAHLSAAAWSISEFYTYLFSHHLPTRFPLHFTPSPSGTLVQNNTTEDSLPVIAQSASNALRAIGENVDEDFVILLPSAEGWRVGAFAMCFPSGLKLAEKLGWKMTSVQTSGTQKLDSSFDRLLTKLSPGAAHGMSRMNWSIARTQELFTPSGSHCYEGEEEPSNAKITVEECALRVERQTLWKLPGTGAVVFGIKTYTYPLSQIKTEDNGAEAQRLALAIESLGEDMGHFRAGSVWGDQVLSYLRS